MQDTKDEGISAKILSKVAVKLNATRLELLACHLGIDPFQFDAIKEDHTKHYERAMAVLKEWYNMGKGGITELYQTLQETGHYQAARQSVLIYIHENCIIMYEYVITDYL